MIVTFGKSSFELNDVDGDDSIKDLKSRLILLSGMDTIKLIENGTVVDDNSYIRELHQGKESKLMMIGSKNANIPDDIKNVRIKDDFTERPRKFVRSSQQLRSQPIQHMKYGFSGIQTLSGFSDEWKAKELLEVLANDPGILAVMKKHKWLVGSLCEMFPEGYVGVSDVCVMGLNENKGQKILLRLRTDDLQGFRKILSIKKVLFHELAHNIYGEHDDNFYILMRTIELECNELDWRNSKIHTLSERSQSVYRAEENEASAQSDQVYRLGGDNNQLSKLFPAEMMAANAAALRAQHSTSIESVDYEPTTTKEDSNEDNNDTTNLDKITENLESSTVQINDHQIDAAIVVQSNPNSEIEQSNTVASSNITESVAIIQANDNIDGPTIIDQIILFQEFISCKIEESVAVILMEENSSSATIVQKILVLQDAIKSIFDSLLSKAVPTKEALISIFRGLNLVLKLLTNIKSQPSNPKYQFVKKTNSTIQQAMLNVPQIRDIFLTAGFREIGSGFQYSRSDPGLLYIIYSLMEDFVKEMKEIFFIGVS